MENIYSGTKEPKKKKNKKYTYSLLIWRETADQQN